MNTQSIPIRTQRGQLALESLRISPFQRAVYRIVERIPRGATLTYSQIAQLLGKPGASQAVGQALKKNPFPGDRIPCHRVIHKSGKVEGYLGSRDPNSPENRRKHQLLLEEGILCRERD